jgi:hypothetical protein
MFERERMIFYIFTVLCSSLNKTTVALRVDGLVLEAAFNRMEEEVRNFKLARGMARLFNLDIGQELRRAGAEFRSTDYLANLTQPTLGRS